MAESQGLDPRHDPIYQRGYDPAVHGSGTAPGDAEPSRRSRARRTADEQLFAPPGAPPRERPASRPEQAPTTSGPADASAAPPQNRIAPPDWSPFAAPREGDSQSIAGGDRPTGVGDSDRVVVEGGAHPHERDRPDVGSDPRSLPPWRNPYLVGLVVGGVILTLVGFQMFRAALGTIYVDFARGGILYEEMTSEDGPDPRGELIAMQIGWSLGPILFALGIATLVAVVVFVAVRWRRVLAAPTELDRAATSDTHPVPTSPEQDRR